MNDKIRASLVASAAVALLAACASTGKPTPVSSGTMAHTVRCQGINECKGRGECSGVSHPCGAHTECKGQGWLTVPSASECTARGGKVL